MSKQETLGIGDVLDRIVTALLTADGKLVAELHNQVCDVPISYDGDSIYTFTAPLAQQETDVVFRIFVRHEANFVVAYQDEQCKRFMCRWPVHYGSAPKRHETSVMLHCSRYKIKWLEDKE